MTCIYINMHSFHVILCRYISMGNKVDWRLSFSSQLTVTVNCHLPSGLVYIYSLNVAHFIMQSAVPISSSISSVIVLWKIYILFLK